MSLRERWLKLEREVRRCRLLEGAGVRVEESPEGTRLWVDEVGGAVAAVGAGGVLMRTTAAGAAPLVEAEGYGEGVAGEPTQTGVPLRIVNVAEGEAVAAGTWVLAVKAGAEWVGLLPTWR